MPSTNDPYPNNVTGIADWFGWANQVTDNLFGYMFLLVIFIALFIMMKHYDTARAFTAASFLTSLVAIVFYVTGIINVFMLSLFILGALGGLFWLTLQNTQD